MVVTLELNDYVQKARGAGLSDDAIRAELLKIGWGVADVNAVVPPPTPMPPAPVLQNPFQPAVVTEAKPPVSQMPQTQTLSPIRHSRMPFIVTVVALLVVGGAVYYFLPQIVTYADKLLGNSESDISLQNEQDNTMPPVPVNNFATSTTNWQAYRDDIYGFEVKYPELWRLSDRGKESASIETSDLGSLSIQVVPGKILPASGLTNTVAFYTQKGDTILLSDEFYTVSSSTTSQPIDSGIFNAIISTFRFLPQATSTAL